MIFVTTGTVTFPFKRLVESALHFYLPKKNEEVVIQTGAYEVQCFAPHILVQSFFSPEVMEKYYRSANTIISAAGEGTLLEILMFAQRKPILFPRLKRFHEHVDDQQLFTARALVEQKKAYLARNSSDLYHLLQGGFGQKKQEEPLTLRSGTAHQNLVRQLHQFTRSL